MYCEVLTSIIMWESHFNTFFTPTITMSYRYSHYHPICPMQPIQHPEHLFRVIRAYDVVPEDGFECGDQAAGLTFEQLIQKGFNNKVKSQFISRTKSAST